MALITGKDCDLKIGTGAAAKSYSGVVNKFELKFDMTKVEYQTLTGPLAAGGTESGTLSITFAYDAGAVGDSLFDALWNSAGESVDFVATIGTSTYTGKAVAVRPGANAEAGAVSEVTVDMALNGIPTKGTKPAATK